MAWSWVDILAARSIWSDVVPVGLIVMGAALLIWALWRGQGRRGRMEPAAPEVRPSRADPGRVLNEAQELASLLAEQMDRQAARLEELIAEADSRIRRLERMNSAPLKEPVRPAQSGDAADPLNRRIYELADEGVPPVEIARALQQQTGKVELILALRKR